MDVPGIHGILENEEDVVGVILCVVDHQVDSTYVGDRVTDVDHVTHIHRAQVSGDVGGGEVRPR